MKTCRKCGEEKPLTQFSLSRQGVNGPVYRSNCKSCQAAEARKWFRENKVRHAETRHKYNILSQYGMSAQEYLDLLAAQGGVCAICGNGEPVAHGRTGTQFRLSVDHSHETGKIRGLLCQKCNRAIGLLGDNTELLRKAIRYLGGQ